MTLLYKLRERAQRAVLEQERQRRTERRPPPNGARVYEYRVVCASGCIHGRGVKLVVK